MRIIKLPKSTPSATSGVSEFHAAAIEASKSVRRKSNRCVNDDDANAKKGLAESKEKEEEEVRAWTILRRRRRRSLKSPPIRSKRKAVSDATRRAS